MVKTINISDIPVKKAYFVKVGSLPIRNIKHIAKNLEQEFIRTFKRTLHDSEKVTRFEQLNYNEKIGVAIGQSGNTPINFQFINCPYNIEMEVKKITAVTPFFNERDIDLSNRFSFIYNGFGYIYYRECDIKKKICKGYVEAREALTEVFEKNFFITHTAPNPLRQDFYFIITKGRNKYESPISIGGKLIFILNETTDIKKVLSRLLSIETLVLQKFYTGSQLSHELEAECDSFKAKYSKIFILTATLHTLKFWNIIKKHKLVTLINKQYSDLYRALGRFVNLEEELQKNRSELSEKLKTSFVLQTIQKELLTEYEHSHLNHNALLQTLPSIRYHIEDYQRLNQLLLTALVSIISAIIGGAISFFALK